MIRAALRYSYQFEVGGLFVFSVAGALVGIECLLLIGRQGVHGGTVCAAVIFQDLIISALQHLLKAPGSF